MLRYLFTFLTLLLCTCLVSGQALRGKVLDTKKIPIPGAYVYSTSGEKHAHSNKMGQFELQPANVGDTIVVSFLGYKNIERVVQENDLNTGIELILEEKYFELDQVSVTNSIQTVSQVTAIDLKTNPVKSSQEVLRTVPGLFIAQHAGGGKAEQIFLRGFDIDHGTDISITVDGMPVNMVSHAHGQGYADLHFVIPETIDKVDFGKGPYYSDHGNFTTAGYVDFSTKDELDQSLFGVEFGQFNTFRTVGMFDLLGNDNNESAYLAAEFIMSDGPFDSPQQFNRINVMGKYKVDLANNDRLSVLVSRFQSKWDASGQIPQRLVDDGTISRFGAVDDTEGGSTSRTNFALDHTKVISKNSFLRTQAFFSHYDFELFSNFTFFLENPDRGDQIRQSEDRKIYGLNTTMFQNYTLGNGGLELSYGLGLRYDDVNDNELSRTANRKVQLEGLAFGQVDETNINAFINAEFDFGKWLINPGLRLDVFNFSYIDELNPIYENLHENKAFVSPKLNIIYNPSLQWQVFLKSGVGFHSNDSRVVVAQSGEEVLPAAYGVDLGTVWKPFPRLWFNAAAWYLFLEQEFVYVGDAAIVEPSGKTERRGIDFGIRYQITDQIFFDSDLTYTDARAIDEPEGADYIPLAPDFTAAGGISFRQPKGFNAGIRYRYLKDRPANEDNSIVALGFLVVDANASYTFDNLTLGVSVENLLDTEWNEAQFATESRLQNEVAPVEELHFTPGVPFFLRGNLQYRF